MAVTVGVSLVSSGTPQPVQVVVAGMTAGQAFTVAQTDAWGSRGVSGGQGVATGEQVILIDRRAPLNIPIHYAVTTAGTVTTSAPITVPYGRPVLIQSLDGLTLVDFVWRSNGLPSEPVIRSHTFDVAGRDRPPVRFVAGGDGGGALEVRTDRANSEKLHTLLKRGRPLVVRTNGTIRDFPPAEIIAPQPGAASRLWDSVSNGQMGTDRVWTVPYILVDDPEPSVAQVAFTWDYVDALGLTWDEFDALALTGDQVDAYNWAQLK